MNQGATDYRIRQAAFEFLDQQIALHGEVLPRRILEVGFTFEGRKIPLVSPQGIFKPAAAELPLTITTVPPARGKPRPYRDTIGSDGHLEYRYRGSSPQHSDNVGLREAMRRGTPLIYLYGLVPGQYFPAYPVFIVGDDPRQLSFQVRVDDGAYLAISRREEPTAAADARRSYVTVMMQRRVHQQAFRLRVLRAYQDSCAVCRLRHQELLEAAHILPDAHPRGEPIVPNGLALCRLHHAAFDGDMLGIRPDFRIEIRRDVLEEEDGPMLVHGLQGFHGQMIHVPRYAELRPNQEFLEERFTAFLSNR